MVIHLFYLFDRIDSPCVREHKKKIADGIRISIWSTADVDRYQTDEWFIVGGGGVDIIFEYAHFLFFFFWRIYV